MNEQFESNRYDSLGYARENEKQKFLARTYGWMALALLISAGSAFAVASSETLLLLIFGSGIGFWILAIGEIALVWWLSAAIKKLSVGVATVAFVVYSVLNGALLSSIFFLYDLTTIGYTFVASAGMFGGMALFGMKTKQNLRPAGRYLIMALWGVILVSLLNIFLRSSGLDWIISLAVVAIFIGLTAYDSQKILATAGYADGSDTFKKAAIIGALSLYLDFINIFLSLLRLFGRRRWR